MCLMLADVFPPGPTVEEHKRTVADRLQQGALKFWLCSIWSNYTLQPEPKTRVKAAFILFPSNQAACGQSVPCFAQNARLYKLAFILVTALTSPSFFGA